MSYEKALVLKDDSEVKIKKPASLSEVYHWVLTQSNLNVKRIKTEGNNE